MLWRLLWGAELAQRSRDGAWKPLAFFSRTLTTPQKKYSAFDRELLAIYLAVKHFRHFLEGKQFTVFTDHKPLTLALASSSERSPRQTRHLSFIAEFTSDIKHIQGECNVVADMLSRPTISAVTPGKLPGIDFRAMFRAQDPSSAKDTSLTLTKVLWNGVSLWCDNSTGVLRPLVPVTFCQAVFQALHSLSHGGVRPTTKLISTRFVWPDLKKNVRDWTRACLPCQ